MKKKKKKTATRNDFTILPKNARQFEDNKAKESVESYDRLSYEGTWPVSIG